MVVVVLIAIVRCC